MTNITDFNGQEFEKKEVALFDEQYLPAFKCLSELIKQKKDLEKQEKEIKKKLEAAMDEYAIRSVENEFIKITRVEANPGNPTVDLDAMKKEEPKLFGELCADYPKTSGKKKAYVKFTVK